MAGIAGFLGLITLALAGPARLALEPPAGRPMARPATGDRTADDAEVYTKRASLLVERTGLEREGLSVVGFLERGFTRVELGLFDVRLPAEALKDATWCSHMSEIARALIQTQLAWAEWVPAGESGTPRELKGHVKTLNRWVDGWKPKAFPSQEELRGRDLLEAGGAKAKVLEAAKFFASYMRESGGPGAIRQQEEPAKLVFLPKRADFVEFLALVGWLEEKHRPFFWNEDGVLWTEFDFDGVRAIALEFATQESRKDYTRALKMTAKNPLAMEQQVVQLATRSLLENSLGPDVEATLAAGLANNMVIDLYDEVDTRTDGDLRGRQTTGRSVFVPGAASDGSMPAASAESRWRANKGKGYFSDVLHQSQKDGSRKADEKWQKNATFILQSDDKSSTFVVTAPFLGADAVTVPPPEYRGDSTEFLRAYRAAFLNWLRKTAEGKESNELFARLMAALAEKDADIMRTIDDIYGMPLSGPGEASLMEETLEGRFLIWLSKL